MHVRMEVHVSLLAVVFNVFVRRILLEHAVNGVRKREGIFSVYRSRLFSIDLFEQYLSQWWYVSTNSTDTRWMFMCKWFYRTNMQLTYAKSVFCCWIFREFILGDSCTNFPCRNGAGCASLLTDAGTGWSAYRCNCPPGFYGQNCDTREKAIMFSEIIFQYWLFI